MTNRRRASLLVLCMVAAAVAGSSVGASPPPPPPSALLNTNLYWGTFRPSSSCANPKSCTTFDAALTNTSKVTLNSFMIGVKNIPFTKFSIDGASCKATGSKFGPNFRNAWLCLNLNVPPGASVSGSGQAQDPLTANVVVRYDWSNKGSAGGLFPDSSEDIHFAPVITPLNRLDLELAETEIENAIYLSTVIPGATPAEIRAEARKAGAAIATAEADVNDGNKNGSFQPGVATEILKFLNSARTEYTGVYSGGIEPKTGFAQARASDIRGLRPTILAMVHLPFN